jgi:PAS domain-containing protein
MSQTCGLLLCVTGRDGYFKQLNPAWTTRLGWTVQELQARPFR